MKKMIFYIVLGCFLFQQYGYGQCSNVRIKGSVQDKTNLNGFYNLMIINLTTKSGKYGRPNGHFSITAAPGDKIVFSAKQYHRVSFIVPKSSTSCLIDTIISIIPIVQEYSTVYIHPEKTLSEIKEDRKSIITKEERKKTVLEGLADFQHPITALYNRFSKEGKSRRKVAAMRHKDKIVSILKDLLRTYVSYDVIYLKEDQFIDFIHYLNINESLLKNADDYNLILYIQQKLEDYKRLHPEIFNSN